jgi:ATP-dependent DNA ligase
MLLLPTTALPDGPAWLYELKLDGYRAIAFKRDRTVYLRSRNDKDFARQYPSVAEALTSLPGNTVVDGELVALDQDGRPSFTALQNHASPVASIVYYVFDVMLLEGRDVMAEPLGVRRELWRRRCCRHSRTP